MGASFFRAWLVALLLLMFTLSSFVAPSSSIEPEPASSPTPSQRPTSLPPEKTDTADGVFHMSRPHYRGMNDSHERYSASSNLRDKIPPSQRDYAHLLNEGPIEISVYTHGSPRVSSFPAGTFFGYGPTDSERSKLAAIGTIVGESQIYPQLRLQVEKVSDVTRVANLQEVYAISPPIPVERADGEGMVRGDVECALCANPDDAYSLTWGQKQQKVDRTITSRDADDLSGDGSMPSDVWFAVIDSGYDDLETPFIEAYASSRIEHCHTYEQGWVSTACNRVGEDNSHGTGVADMLDAYNGHGGTYHVYNFWGTTTAHLQDVYEHILLVHPGIDVISTSTGWGYTGDTCRDFFDGTLRALADTETYVISHIGNPDNQQWIYPATSTWAIGAGGAEDGSSDWTTPTNAVGGFITLTPGDCWEQWDYHQSTDQMESIFKPDVYGFFRVLNDFGGTLTGTSYAQPQVASGAGTIASRFYLGLESERAPFKDWGTFCYNGVVELVWESSAPNGEDVLPTGMSRRGNLADHHAWYLDSWVC